MLSYNSREYIGPLLYKTTIQRDPGNCFVESECMYGGKCGSCSVSGGDNPGRQSSLLVKKEKGKSKAKIVQEISSQTSSLLRNRILKLLPEISD